MTAVDPEDIKMDVASVECRPLRLLAGKSMIHSNSPVKVKEFPSENNPVFLHQCYDMNDVTN